MNEAIPVDLSAYTLLLGENRQQPMNIGSLLFYRMPEGQNADDAAAQFTEEMLRYSKARAPFNHRLVKRMGRPYWEEDADFDITHHVRHLRPPKPGDIKELLKLIGIVHGTTMDRSAPLWYLWIISGLADNRMAVYVQLHHALIDGVSGSRLVTETHSLDPAERDMVPFWARSPAPGPAVPDGSVSTEQVSNILTLVQRVARSQRNVARTFIDSWKNERVGRFGSALYAAPDTPFNKEITGARRFVADSFSLSRIKEVGRKLDATVNDILLMMCGHAVRRYLLDLDALPVESLVAALPVNLRSDDSVGGNQVTLIRASMGTDQETIAGQIDAVKASIAHQKSVLGSLSKEETLIYSMLTLAPAMAHAATGKLDRFKTFNLTLSNVPGSAESLYWNGLELDAIYPVSMPMHQNALNFTVFSYRDSVEMGIIGCRTNVPHLQRILEYLHEGLDLIDAEAQARSG